MSRNKLEKLQEVKKSIKKDYIEIVKWRVEYIVRLVFFTIKILIKLAFLKIKSKI